jgi:hypothetical protein
MNSIVWESIDAFKHCYAINRWCRHAPADEAIEPTSPLGSGSCSKTPRGLADRPGG